MRTSFSSCLSALCLFVCLALAGPLRADEQILRASEHGLSPGQHDAGPALAQLLEQLPENAVLSLAPGEYHFYPDAAEEAEYRYFISNHDQQPGHSPGLALRHAKNITIIGNGAEFIFHGRMLPILIDDCDNICLQDLSLRYATPFSAEGRIVSQTNSSTTLEIQGDSLWCVEDGGFYNTGEGWKDRVRAAIAFQADGRMVPLGRSGDIVWNARAEQIAPTRVRFSINSHKFGLEPGNILVLRSYWRPNPAIFIHNSRNTTLQNIVIHDSMGMGVLGQRSENITIRDGGVVRRPGRYGTTGADATHFSNCRGKIEVCGAYFEGMMDDAINVHATSLGITSVVSPTEIVARYMHDQAYGFELLRAGERVRFIHGQTLENDAQLVQVKSVESLNERELRIILEEPMPASIAEGDALENADWHPAVTFTRNTILHNRARGALFTTPCEVLVEKNDFVWSSGSAILLAGDAQGWYESGACQNVIIRKNRFDHCLTCLFQFTDAIISICPEVKQPEAQNERYHRNILIENNVFLTHRVPLLSAISADGLIFRNNRVRYDDNGPTLFKGVPFRIRHCGEVKLQEVKVP